MHSEGLGDEVGQCLEGAVDDEVGGAVEASREYSVPKRKDLLREME